MRKQTNTTKTCIA